MDCQFFILDSIVKPYVIRVTSFVVDQTHKDSSLNLVGAML
jgi:hypothetical protein